MNNKPSQQCTCTYGIPCPVHPIRPPSQQQPSQDFIKSENYEGDQPVEGEKWITVPFDELKNAWMAGYDRAWWITNPEKVLKDEPLNSEKYFSLFEKRLQQYKDQNIAAVSKSKNEGAERLQSLNEGICGENSPSSHPTAVGEEEEIESVVRKIFYSPATNGKAEQSIKDGVEAVKNLLRKYREQGGEEVETTEEYVLRLMARALKAEAQVQVLESKLAANNKKD